MTNESKNSWDEEVTIVDLDPAEDSHLFMNLQTR